MLSHKEKHALNFWGIDLKKNWKCYILDFYSNEISPNSKPLKLEKINLLYIPMNL